MQLPPPSAAAQRSRGKDSESKRGWWKSKPGGVCMLQAYEIPQAKCTELNLSCPGACNVDLCYSREGFPCTKVCYCPRARGGAFFKRVELFWLPASHITALPIVALVSTQHKAQEASEGSVVWMHLNVAQCSFLKNSLDLDPAPHLLNELSGRTPKWIHADFSVSVHCCPLEGGKIVQL